MAKKPERVLGTGAVGDLDDPGKQHPLQRTGEAVVNPDADEADMVTDLDIRQAEAEKETR